MMQVKSATLGKYTILRHLGAGATSIVKLGKDPQGAEVALKIFKSEVFDRDQVFHELSMMKLLHHQNLVNLIEVMDRAEFTDVDGQRSYVQCIALEVVGEGELFDYIAIPGRFNEITTRTYFRWLMEGLRYMHQQGICHRDIKPENLLLNREYFLKIADFGFAAFIAGEDNSGILHERLGTEGYMAPEIYLMKYSGQAVDIFAAGVVLFIMFSASNPFQKAVVSDPYFKLLRDKRNLMFWSQHSKRKPADFFPPLFQDLIDRMLAFEPSERITIEEVFTHPWFVGEVLSGEGVAAQFQERKMKVKEYKQKIRKQKQEKRNSRERAMNNKDSLDRETEDELTTLFISYYQKEQTAKRELQVKPNITRKDLVLREKPEVFFPILFTLLHEKITVACSYEEVEFRPEFEISGNKITVVYRFDYEGSDEQVVIQMVVNMTVKKDICVSFVRSNGNYLYYRHLIERIKEEFINCEVRYE